MKHLSKVCHVLVCKCFPGLVLFYAKSTEFYSASINPPFPVIVTLSIAAVFRADMCLPPRRSVLDSSNFDDYPPDSDPLPQDDLSGWDADF